MMYVKKWGHPKRDDCLEFKDRNFFWKRGMGIFGTCALLFWLLILVKYCHSNQNRLGSEGVAY